LNITEKRPFWLIPDLIDRLMQWQKDPMGPIKPYQADNEHPKVAISFAKLQSVANSDIIIFLEDSGRMQQQAQQLKLASLGRLTASIAHEIRNPLGAISHAAQLMEEAPNLGPADKRLLDIIHNHSARVNNIIETILQLSRRRPSQIDKLQLTDLIEQCITERELQSQVNQDQIDVKNIVPMEIEVDSNQVKQVLHNLIDNGLRYSEQNVGKRKLKISSAHLSDTGEAFIDIEDYGSGVPRDQIKNLFEPFYTTENRGTGLGLYIAEELCEANRLLLSYVDNKPGGCFRIIFSHTISQS
jgi:two-component system sensor histidine kinase PilS (NtrC family)